MQEGKVAFARVVKFVNAANHLFIRLKGLGEIVDLFFFEVVHAIALPWFWF